MQKHYQSEEDAPIWVIKSFERGGTGTFCAALEANGGGIKPWPDKTPPSWTNPSIGPEVVIRAKGASGIESLVEPGGIVIPRRVFEQILGIDKLSLF